MADTVTADYPQSRTASIQRSAAGAIAQRRLFQSTALNMVFSLVLTDCLLIGKNSTRQIRPEKPGKHCQRSSALCASWRRQRAFQPIRENAATGVCGGRLISPACCAQAQTTRASHARQSANTACSWARKLSGSAPFPGPDCNQTAAPVVLPRHASLGVIDKRLQPAPAAISRRISERSSLRAKVGVALDQRQAKRLCW